MTTFELEDAKKTYPDFEVHYNDEIEEFVKTHGNWKVYINKGVNSDSGLTTLVPHHDWFKDLNINVTDLHNVMSESRSIKNPMEIEMLRLANLISSEAHVHTMRQCKVGIRESALASVFDAYCLENYNCKFLPYNQICACGLNPAVLHYPDWNDLIPAKTMCLIDMGHAVHHYVADITCCYPSDGVFTDKQKEIYWIVLKANTEVHKAAKIGTSWPSMHILAERIILTELQKLGIVK